MRRWLPFGAPAPTARLFEDIEHFAGVRDYEPGDPMHHVHWRLSAHAGHLQTKTYEPTRSAEVLFALDLSDGEPFWERADAAIAEETIGMASYLARPGDPRGLARRVVANTHLRRGRGPLRVSAAASAGQESILFTALARMPNQPTDDLAPILREVGRRLTRRTTVVRPVPHARPLADARDGTSATAGVRRAAHRAGRSGGRPGDGLMMRSLTAPDDAGGTRLRIAVAAAIPAAIAEAAVFCLPVYTLVSGGVRTPAPIAVFLPLFLAAFAGLVALATRYRSSTMVAPVVAVAAIVAGVLLAHGAVQREVFTVLVFLLVGLRAVGSGFRDWREPVAGTFLFGALVLAIESVVGAAASQDWGPPLIVLMPVFFVGSLVSRAVSVWMTDDAEELRTDERERGLRRAVSDTIWVPVAMVAAVGLGLRDGVLDHLGSFLAPVGNALVSLLVFVFEQLARPIFWLVDKLGIDPDGARRVLQRAQRSAARAREDAPWIGSGSPRSSEGCWVSPSSSSRSGA